MEGEKSALQTRRTNTEPPSSGGASNKAESYYLANFKAILESCMLPTNPEAHVISVDHATMVGEFRLLSSHCQQLYVRLFLRKHQWHRTSKISYPEIASNLYPILDELSKEGFLMNEKDLQDPSAVLDLLQTHELKRLCQHFHMPSSVVGSSKSKMVEAIFREDRQHRPLFGKSQILTAVVTKAKTVLGKCVKVADTYMEVFSKMMLLFSLTNSSWLNRDEETDFSQIIYQMLQVRIGRLLYPTYEVFTTTPLFEDREAFQKYYDAIKDEQRLIQAAAGSRDNEVAVILKKIKDLLHDVVKHQGQVVTSLPSFLMPFTSGHIYVRILSQGVEILEKRKKYEEATSLLRDLLAQSVYGKHRRKKWWDRLALNCDYHLKDKEECLRVIMQAIDGDGDALTPPIRLSLTQRAKRILQSKKFKPETAQPPRKKRRRSNKSDGRDRGRGDASDEVAMGTEKDFLSANSELLVKCLSSEVVEDIVPPPEVSITGKQLGNGLGPFYVTKSSSSETHSSSLPSLTAPLSSSSSSSSKSVVAVENYAVSHYLSLTSESWPCGLHAENATFSTLFAVLMWEVIFSRVPDVFRAPFQDYSVGITSQSQYDLTNAVLDECRS